MRVNLKALGLALVAAFAMSAVAASVAQASTPAAFTAAEYPAVATGHEEGALNYFEITGGGAKTECNNVTYEATLAGASHELTVTPHYTECEETISGNPATVHLNGCDFRFTAGTYTAAPVDDAHGKVHIVCPVGKKIEITVSAFGSPICAVDVHPQTLEGGITYTNIPGGGATPQDYVTVDVDITNDIEYTETDLSFFCPNTNNHHTGDGNFVSQVRIKGYEDLKKDHTKPGTPEAKEYTHSGTEVDIDVGPTP